MSNERIRVWPKEGLTVRDPVTRAPIEPGQEVESSRAIMRLVLSGDLTTVERAHGVEQQHGEREEG